MALGRGVCSDTTQAIKKPSGPVPWQEISAEVIVTGFKMFCISHEMDGRMRKKLGVLAVNMRQDGNCRDMEAETSDMNGEQ
jgi:hypothetical protein